jgi:outer membrane protein assembly factor BamB
VVLALMVSGTAAGCVRLPRTVAELPDATWTSRLGDAAHAPFIDERVPSVMDIAWDEDVGRGMPFAAIVQHGLIVSAVSGGGIITANAESGRRYWGRRFNGSVAGQVLRVGDRIYFATQHRNGTLYALDLHRGRRIWSRRIGAPAAAEPAWAEGRIYLATQREIQAVNDSNGNVVWRARTRTAPEQPPVVLGSDLLVAVRDTLYTFRRSDGDVVSRHRIAGEPSAPIAVRSDTLIIAMHPGIVAAYVDNGARELWRRTLDAPVLAAPVATPDGVFALTRDAQLHVLGPVTAHRIIAIDGAATESLTVTADGALIGTLDGRIIFVRRDGTRVWEEKVDGSVRAPAVVRNSAVYVGTLNGRLVKLTSG